MNGLPQTAAAWAQLLGRLRRTGQRTSVRVRVVRAVSATLYPEHGACDLVTCDKPHCRDLRDWYRIKLKRTVEAGQWIAPGGVRPKRKLYVVSATYRPSTVRSALNPTGRFQVDCPVLRYGGRDDYIKGLGALINIHD